MKKSIFFILFIAVCSFVFAGFHNYDKKHWEVWRWVSSTFSDNERAYYMRDYMLQSVEALAEVEPRLTSYKAWGEIESLDYYQFFILLKERIEEENWEEDLWPFAVDVLEEHNLFTENNESIKLMSYWEYTEIDRSEKETFLGAMVFIYQVIGHIFPELYTNSVVLQNVDNVDFDPYQDLVVQVDNAYARGANPIITAVEILSTIEE